MVDNLRDLRPGQLVVGGGRIVKIAKVSNVKRETPYTAKGLFVIDGVALRTVPPHFIGGKLDTNHYGSTTVCTFAHGDREQYHNWIEKSNWYLDLALTAVGESDPIIQLIPEKLLKLHKLTKQDLMAYVVKVHGYLVRDDIMRMVAALEGLPWVPTSNTEYFQAFMNDKATLWSNKKKGQKKLYTLGEAGEKRATRVLAVIGEAPALAAK